MYNMIDKLKTKKKKPKSSLIAGVFAETKYAFAL